MRSPVTSLSMLAAYALLASGLPLGWHLAAVHTESACCAESYESGLKDASDTANPGTPAVPAHDETRCGICHQIAVVKTAVELPADEGSAPADQTCQAVLLVVLPLLPGERFKDAAARAPPC